MHLTDFLNEFGTHLASGNETEQLFSFSKGNCPSKIRSRDILRKINGRGVVDDVTLRLVTCGMSQSAKISGTFFLFEASRHFPRTT